MGQSLEIHGIPRASHWSATGLTVSGLDDTIIMSILSLLTRSPATWAARLVSDWLSRSKMLIGCFLPSPKTIPSPAAASHSSLIHESGIPNADAGPVSGETKPNLISLPISTAALTAVSYTHLRAHETDSY